MNNSEIKLHPTVMETIDSYAKYYAEKHGLGISIRDDMIYVAEVTVRWADAEGASDMVAVPVKQLEHWAEYWNGSANEKAMSDALEHILGEVDDLLRAAKESGHE